MAAKFPWHKSVSSSSAISVLLHFSLLFDLLALGDLRREWYLRYQPLNYEHIDLALGTKGCHPCRLQHVPWSTLVSLTNALRFLLLDAGGAETLQRLCEEAQGYGIIVHRACKWISLYKTLQVDKGNLWPSLN